MDFAVEFRSLENSALAIDETIVRISILKFLVACYATLQPALSVRPSDRRSVRPSVRPSVRHTLLFLGFCGLWPHCSCPNDGEALNMAPAHPHATWVAVYPALFFSHGYYNLEKSRFFFLTRPDTRLSKSRAGGQGQCHKRLIKY